MTMHAHGQEVAAVRLAAAHPHPQQVHAAWGNGGAALIPTGRLWDAVKLPETAIHREVLGTDPETVRAGLACFGIHGPVIHDPGSGAYYFLVPPGTAQTWDAHGTACLGDACYVGVPAPHRTARPGVHWLITPDAPDLCAPDAVAALVEAALGPRSAA